MLRAIKVRIYPNAEQEAYMRRLLGCCRFAYNACLRYRKSSWEESGASVSDCDTIKYLVPLKQEFPFLADVHSKVIQQSVRDLNKAYGNFFKEHRGYPLFKSKKDNHDSCRFPKDAIMGVSGNRISLIKNLRDILFKCSSRDERRLNKHRDAVKSATLRLLPSGKFILSVLLDVEPQVRPIKGNACVGVDLGIKSFATVSDGTVFENPHFKKTEMQHIKRLQRSLSKKEKGSKRRYKARLRLAKLCERIANRKEWYIHDVVNRLLDENQVVGVEDLNVKGMTKNHRLAEAVTEVSFGKFLEVLRYKAVMRGRTVVAVGRFYPSSKTCHECGYVYKGLTLSEREWMCPQCGAHVDRDFNASLNIRDEAMKIVGLSSPEVTLAETPPAGFGNGGNAVPC